MTNTSIYNNSICIIPIYEISLDSINSDPDFVYHDQLQIDNIKPIEENIARKQLQDKVIDFKDQCCSEREKYILNRTFYGGASQPQIANEIGISQQMISKILKGIIAKGREYFKELSYDYA